MRFSIEFNKVDDLLAIVLVDSTSIFKILLKMVCWNFVKLHHFVHFIKKLPNNILLFFKIILDLKQLFNCTNFATFSLCFRCLYIRCSFFLQIPFYLLIFILCVRYNSRLWHGKLVPNGFTLILELLQNDLNQFLIFLITLLAHDVFINSLHFILNLFT